MKMDRRQFLGVTATLALSGCRSAAPANDTAQSSPGLPMPKMRPTRGPLRVHDKNPRYFADARGRAVYLAGAHTWPNCVDQGLTSGSRSSKRSPAGSSSRLPPSPAAGWNGPPRPPDRTCCIYAVETRRRWTNETHPFGEGEASQDEGQNPVSSGHTRGCHSRARNHERAGSGAAGRFSVKYGAISHPAVERLRP